MRFPKTTALLALIGVAFAPFTVAAEESSTNWRFVMAHKPDNPDNVALIQDFSDRVKERTHGQLNITPVMPKAIEGEYKSHPHRLAISKLYTDEVEMRQVSVKQFLRFSPSLDVLDMPLMFQTHEHATRVLDGKIGSDLRQAVLKDTDGRVKGLSFTYSGGFRNIYTTKPVDSLADLKGMKMRTPGGRMSRDAIEHLGADLFFAPAGSKYWVQSYLNGTIEADEAELIRMAQWHRQFPMVTPHIKTVLETNHNLFLTMVSVSGAAFNRLTDEQQDILQEEAQRLAVLERELSIQQETEAKAMFQKAGVRFISMSEQDQKILEDMARQTYAKYDAHLGEWMQAIADVSPQPVYATNQH